MTSKRVSKRSTDSKNADDSKDRGAKKGKKKRESVPVPEDRGELVILTGGWRWLDNDGVNLAATLCGAAVALVGSH